MRKRLRLWAWIWLGWTALALFFAISLWLNYISRGQPANFRASLIVSLTEWWIWALLTPIPLALAGRWPIARPHRFRNTVLHVLAGSATAFVKVLLERTVRIWIFGAAAYLLPSNLALHFLVYFAIVLLAMAAAFYRNSRARELKAAQLETRLQAARLQLLSAQLQPHFLFNALNTIAETVHEDPDKADRMITSLSDLLRATLDDNSHVVPLAHELGLAEHYLAMQQARFGDRLRVEIDVPDIVRDRNVPRLLLQPLLENAVHHGVSSRREGGWIRVHARIDAGGLRLTVEDDGNGVEEGGPRDAARSTSDGIGLGNTRARLDALYGSRATLDLTPRAPRGTIVTVTIPDAVE